MPRIGLTNRDPEGDLVYQVLSAQVGSFAAVCVSRDQDGRVLNNGNPVLTRFKISELIQELSCDALSSDWSLYRTHW